MNKTKIYHRINIDKNKQEYYNINNKNKLEKNHKTIRRIANGYRIKRNID